MSAQTEAITKLSNTSHADTPPESPEITAKQSDSEMYMALKIIMGFITQKSLPFDGISVLPPPPNTPNDPATEAVQTFLLPSPLDGSRSDVQVSKVRYQKVYEM
jgi:hypothetical protein